MILLAFWGFGFLYPYYIHPTFFGKVSPYYQDAGFNEMSYFSILRIIFNYLEIILLILAIGLRTQRNGLSQDENLDQL